MKRKMKPCVKGKAQIKQNCLRVLLKTVTNLNITKYPSSVICNGLR